MSIKSSIRSVPNYPKPGVMYRDITTLLQNANGFHKLVDDLVKPYIGQKIDKVAGIEARGFIIAGAIAHQLNRGFIPVRKMGKLPWKTFGQDYELEYGSGRVEIHTDAIAKGDRVLVVDDLLATGGTAEAAIALIRKAGGKVMSCAFVIDLPDLGGRRRIEEHGIDVLSLCTFEGK